ncbi:MAG: MoxR family ATPase [Bacillati bacterium ANGP1]|uniref:MoxR family ATPase n=1 Tax=Candidatus Segetimicrobium genomatis TaxID=2569760 RepID=A0A537K7S7_9BACT|nr:MAG: MoxR family ATPase [Terrabacteria group bacterium ANGP1]
MGAGSRPPQAFGGIPEIMETLQEQGYIADRDVALSIHLSVALHKPLLIEGAAGVGKTEIAKVMARAVATDLIRLQCYEGLDVHTALYEWNYQRQMLRIKLEETTGRPVEEKEHLIFSEPFMLKRPLLQAITADQAPVLLIDEVDRADEEFEAFLLEVLSDFQVSIPEIGTIRARHIPYVVLTSNRTRDLSDALRRRCLYLWIDYPTFEKELAIIHRKVPEINDRLARQIGAFMQLVRRVNLDKVPGIAETLDWSAALLALHRDHLDPTAVEETLGCLCKDQEDLTRVRARYLGPILERIDAIGQSGDGWNSDRIAQLAAQLPKGR